VSLREELRVLGVWRWFWLSYLYRPTSRLLHRFNLHYMRPMPIIERDRQQFWCEWCGLRDTKYIGPPMIGKDAP
jgi:hypothetical protein